MSFLVWRVGLFILAWVAEKFIAFTPRFPYSDVLLIPSGLPSWIWSFANFDGVHYLTIADSSYSAQYTQVFFPLYPLLLAVINKILPFLNPIISGLLVSNIFFLFAMVVLRKLLSIDYKQEVINWMVLFLIIFPTSFFFGSVYTESLFLFLVVSSFYAARKKRWLLAGIFGGLASATRLAGIFLLPALLWEWRKEKIKLLHSPILYLVPFGLISYMFYLQYKFGDWLYFWHVQPVFGAQRLGDRIILLPQVIWRYFKILISVSIYTEGYWISFSELFFTVLSILLLIIAHMKKVRLSYLIFSWCAVITPTLTGTLSSMSRYVLIAFPIFITLGLIKNKIYKMILFFVFCCLLSVFTILFTRGHWVS